MKNSRELSLKGWGKILFVFLFLVFINISCHYQPKLSIIKTPALDITETGDCFEINAERYHLKINKINGLATLNNHRNEQYTSFPLAAISSLNNNRESGNLKYNWNKKSKTISGEMWIADSMLQQFSIRFNKEFFTVKFDTKPSLPSPPGVFIFRNQQRGFDTSQWSQYFSPEPDKYFKENPAIDIRVDRDQQWKFTPAPLNLSFETPAGWFSIGLIELPDATVFSFRDSGIWLDYPWQIIEPDENNFYQLPSLVFTFNESPWEAVSDYSDFIYENSGENLSKPSNQKKPVWWLNPIVSPRGEQKLLQISAADSLNNSEWIKNYILKQLLKLSVKNFNFILEDKWCEFYGDPQPSSRFRELRALIDWCHERDIKVILSWKSWKVERGSLAATLGLADGEYCDSTHPLFQTYVDSCCEFMFGEDPDFLNADGIQFDDLFLVRDPAVSQFADPPTGVGIKEAHHYLKTFYQSAKKIKPEALIIGTAVDPHFANVLDMTRINDDWDNKLRREKRARIILAALPNVLISADAYEMVNSIALHHYVTGAMYGIPAIHYLENFSDGKINEETNRCINTLLRFSQQKPPGQVKFIDYGHWRIINNKNKVAAESLPGGNGILIFENSKQVKFVCTENKNPHVVFPNFRVKEITNDKGDVVSFEDRGQGIYQFKNLIKGEEYSITLKKIITRNQ